MSRPIRILHTRVVTGSGGGPDKTILRSNSHINRDRYHLAAAYLYPAGDIGINTLIDTANRERMPIHPIPERSALDRRAIRAMLDICRRLHIDIWHSHDYKTDLLGLVLRRHHPMKLVTTVHGFTRETWRTRAYAAMNGLALLGYDHVLAVSPPLVRYCAMRGVNPDRLTYLPNGIVLDEYQRTRSTPSAREALNLSEQGPHLAIVSRLSPEKGADRAIKLFRSLMNDQPLATLHIIGDGPERSSLETLAADWGVQKRVRWWGWQTQTRPILEAMDGLLLTSHTEGLPNVILEAMAVGLPIAATRVGAVPEVLDHGRCGVLLAEDESDWAEQVLPLLRPTVQRKQLLDAATKRVAARYDFDHRMKRVETVYEHVMGHAADRDSLTRDTLTQAA